MPPLRSRTVTHGRNMSGARALMRASGVAREDIGRPIVAVANSFTEFVPGHVHLREVGQVVSGAIKAAGAIPREFNTIAVDDGIAMGHGGMLYSLPSRELIADAVEYMVQAHCADALICISNCDKITPGMLIAAMRLNIPTVFVSGGPMEAGKPVNGAHHGRAQARPHRPDGRLGGPVGARRRTARDGGGCLPDVRLLLGHVHRQLDELPDGGDRPRAAGQRDHAGHARRPARPVRAGRGGDRRADRAVLHRRRRIRIAARHRQPRRVRERDGPGRGDGRVDQHDPAPAGRGARGGRELRPQGDRRGVPAGALPVQGGAEQQLPRGGRAPRGRHPGDPRRAGPGRPAQHDGPHRAQRFAAGLHRRLGPALRIGPRRGGRAVPRGPRRDPDHQAVLAVGPLGEPGPRPRGRLHPGHRARLHRGRRPGRALRQPGSPGRDRQDRGRARGTVAVRGDRAGLREPGGGRGRHPQRRGQRGRRGGDPVRGATWRAGDAGNAVSHELPQGQGPGARVRADHRRPLLRRHVRAFDLPHRAGGGAGRRHRPGGRRGPDHDRYPAPRPGAGRARGRPGGPPGQAAGRAAHLPPGGPGPAGQRGAAGVRGDDHLGGAGSGA